MDLQEARIKIDDINRQMLRLFLERMEVAAAIGTYKREHGLPVLNQTRERQILADMAENAPQELEMPVKVLFTTLMDLSRAYQSTLHPLSGRISDGIRQAAASTASFPTRATVACQGVEGAYSQIAADRLFPLADITYCKRFEGVFQAVEQGLCRYGVLPIENSVHGSVNEVYDLMRLHRFSIVRSLKLKVEHRLMTLPGVPLSEVREIYSHSQAIGQCSEFLAEHPGIKVNVCENTAVASKLVSERGLGSIAAISSPACGKLYGLEAKDCAVCNSDANYTRFICISRSPEIYSGANRIGLILTLSHKPGSLCSVLSRFYALGLNLTKLESRPIAGSDFEVRFYCEFEVPSLSDAVLSLLDDLSESCESFAYLGTYGEI